MSDPMWQGIGGIIAIVTLIVAIYQIFTASQPSNPSPSSAANATVLSTLPAAVATAATETVTPTWTMVRSASPAPLDTPELVQTPAKFGDDFLEGAAYWTLGDNDNGYWQESKTVADGGYHWKVTALQSVTTKLPATLPPVSDFELKLSIQLVHPESALYGIFFRENQDGGYYFFLDGKGGFQVNLWKAKEGKVTHLVGRTRSEAIRLNALNTLKISATGSKICFYMNDSPVHEIESSTFAGGQIGVAVALNAGQSAELELRDFELSVLK